MAAAPQIVHAPDQAIAARSNADELALLLACCAQGAGLEGWFSSGTLDWEKFISLAENHRVIPQVYCSLEPYFAEVPSTAVAMLRRKYRQGTCNALWFTHELALIANSLEACGIRAVPYKGPLLAQSLYGDVAARQYHDLDILVLPEDVNPAKAALADVGYVCSLNLRKELERNYLSSGYEYSFDSTSCPHAVELQWRILPRFYAVDFDLEACFERAESLRIGGRTFLNLCPGDLLLILCTHAAKHIWAQISWLLDISKLVGTETIDWDRVWEEAKDLGIRRIVAVNLLLANDLLGSRIPDRIHAWLEADGVGLVLRDEIMQRIRAGQDSDTESIAYFRLWSRVRERRRDKARLGWRLLSTPSVSEWNEVHLPEPLFRFYYLVRLFRLAKRFGVAA